MERRPCYNPLTDSRQSRVHRKRDYTMGENAVDLLVFLQLKDKNFSSCSLDEIAKCCEDTYRNTKEYLDSKESGKWQYGQTTV